MRRAILVATLLAPLAAQGQTWTYLSRSLGLPRGLAVPDAGVASGEEPAAMAVNPAAVGFNQGFTFQYFHERYDGPSGAGASHLLGDGVYAAAGPLALTSEWLRPRGGVAYRKLGLGLGLGGRVAAVGMSWNDWSSHDAAVDGLHTWDLGLTLRPARWLSLGGAALDLGGRLAGSWLPVRWNLGAATRLWNDSVTLSCDLHADDDARGTFRARAVAFGAGWETPWGIALKAQVETPSQRHTSGVPGSTLFLLSLAFQTHHAGVVVATGGTGKEAEGGTVLGMRLSSDSYRGFPWPPRPLLVDLAAELNPPRRLLLPAQRDPYGALVRKLRALARDDEVGPVVLKIDPLSLAPGHLDELRATVLELKARKPVVAWLHGGGLRELYLASAATRVEMLPAAVLTPTGLSSTGLYLGEALARVGVAFQAVAIGRYKNAPDPLTRGDMSPAEREVKEAVLDDFFGRQVRVLAEARKLTEAQVRAMVDQGIFTAADARKAGLVDGLSWPDELDRKLRSSGGLPTGWSQPEPRLAQRWGPAPAVAVIQVSGAIVPGKSRADGLQGAMSGADTVTALVRRATQDGAVRAIVLRVDSPGGDALASDLIWRSLQEARRAGKPVVVSMGSLAASGGYWISTASDAIVAEPSTLTGSIGVFAVKPDLSGLLAKLGIREATVKRGAHADAESVFRPWTAEEVEAIRKEIGAVYDTFLARVAEARKLPAAEVDKLGQGRVWTGAQALQRQLVDRLGSLSDAVALARERAGLPPDAEVRRLEPERGFLESLDPTAGLDGGLLAGLAERAPELRATAALLAMGRVVALPLGWVTPVADAPGESTR